MVISQDIQQKLEKHREERAAKKATEAPTEKKFSQEELEKINEIKSNYDAITLRMGQLHFELDSLNKEKNDLEVAFDENRKSEVAFAQQLTQKYGKGSLDISTGIFTPTE
mgnify:FL=1